MLLRSRARASGPCALPTYLSSDKYLHLVEAWSVLRFAIPEVVLLRNRYLEGSWSFFEVEAAQWCYYDPASDVRDELLYKSTQYIFRKINEEENRWIMML